MAEDLGKVHAKIELYDEIPGVIRDPEKLRSNFSWAVSLGGTNDDKPASGSYNLISLQIMSPDGSPLAASMLPRPTYDPVDNLLVDRTNTSSSADADVYWQEIGVGEEDDTTTEEEAESAFVDLKAVQYKAIVLGQDNRVTTENLQKWGSEVEVVSPLRYSDEEYDELPIDYKGEGFKTKAEREAANKEDEDATDATDAESEEDKNIEETENTYWIKQYESIAGVWWGVETKFPFKDKGWPFWVTIRPSSINLRKGKSKKAVISIRIMDSANNAGTGSKLKDKRERIGAVEFIIDSLGNTYLAYEVKGKKTDSKDKSRKSKDGDRSSGSKPSGKEKDGNTESDLKTSYLTIPVKMPHLSAAFNSGQEMRVGFLQVMGRLCVYTDANRYDVVNLLGTGRKFLQFNLDTPALSVYGYGCTASISAFPMTFERRGWLLLPDMAPEVSEGYVYPKEDLTGLRKGALSDGKLISKPNTLEGQQAGSSRNSNSKGKMYGATFTNYMEVLQDATDVDGKARQRTSTLDITESNYATGMLNPWGRIHLVRSEPIAGISEKHFWYVYFQSQTLSMQEYSPDGVALKDTEDADEDGSTDDPKSIKKGYVGVPILFSILSYKPMDVTSNPAPSSTATLNITEDLISAQFTSQLDSPRPTAVERSGTIRLFNTDGVYSDYLAKARGIKVWLKWSPGEVVVFEDDDIIFSGIAFGRQTSQAPGEEYVTFECVDHWRILDSMQINNSPFYDGFHIGSVVEDLCNRAGIAFVDDVDTSQSKKGGPNFYFLGQGTVYDKPLYRFSGETPIKDCIMETIKNFEVYVYFDNDGTLHMHPVPGGFLFNKTNDKWDPDTYEDYYLLIDYAKEPYQLILDGLEMTSTLSSSIHNSIYILTADRSTGALVVGSRSNKDSLLNPDKIGYLGFVREVRLQRPDLGNQKAAEWWADIVLQMYSKPGFEVEFNTVGHVPDYVPGQFVRLRKDDTDSGGDVFSKKFRVTKIGQNYEADKNVWKTSIGAYQVEAASTSFNPSQEIPREDPDPGESDG